MDQVEKTNFEIQGDRIGHKLTEGLKDGDRQRSWYLVRSATRQEKRAENGLVEAGMAVYVPRFARWRRHAGRKERVERPLFDGYFFAGLGAGQSLYQLDNIDGVHCVVRFSAVAEPRPLRFAVIDKILSAELAGEFDETGGAVKLPSEGEEVQIVGGQFKGFPARFVRLRSQERVEVLFQLFGRWSPLVLKACEIEQLG